MTNTEQTRFGELRAKTDRELASLLQKRLHFAVSGMLSGLDSRPVAEEVCAEADALMPLIYQLPASQRSRIEAMLTRLRMLLEESAETKALAAC